MRGQVVYNHIVDRKVNNFGPLDKSLSILHCFNTAGSPQVRLTQLLMQGGGAGVFTPLEIAAIAYLIHQLPDTTPAQRSAVLRFIGLEEPTLAALATRCEERGEIYNSLYRHICASQEDNQYHVIFQKGRNRMMKAIYIVRPWWWSTAKMLTPRPRPAPPEIDDAQDASDPVTLCCALVDVDSARHIYKLLHEHTQTGPWMRWLRGDIHKPEASREFKLALRAWSIKIAEQGR